MSTKNNLPIIGRAEQIVIPSLGPFSIPAKIDTGADSSSIWVSQVINDGNDILVVFFGQNSKYYSGDKIRFKKSQYNLTRVENSFGHSETRYKIKLPIKVKDKLINASFTLSDRASKTYPILLGIRMLSGKFLVDVQLGEPLKKNKNSNKILLKSHISKLGKRT